MKFVFCFFFKLGLISQNYFFQRLEAKTTCLGCVWDSLFIAYLSLSSQISIFDKNYRCLKELIKITYDPPYNLILAYFNKFYGKDYQKKLKKT